MALTFPLSLAQFFDLLPVEALTWDPTEAIELDETAGGEILKADIGEALWTGQLDLTVMTWEEATDIGPLVNVLRRPGTSFMVADPRRPWPRKDPLGTILGASAVKISSVASNYREITLKGLPSGYQLSRGDLFSFAYGSAPTRYALHELVAPATANGAGIAGPFEVTPPLRDGVAVNADVQLVWPRCKAVLRGGASGGTSRADITENASLSWAQTLR